MKKLVCLAFVTILVFTIAAPVYATSRAVSIVPALFFSGTTVKCEASVITAKMVPAIAEAYPVPEVENLWMPSW